MIPVSGEQHERAVEAALATPVQGSRGRDVVMQARIRAALDAYHRSLREQDVVLVDLREVVTALEEQREMSKAYREHPEALLPAHTFIEHRFAADPDVHAAHNETVTRCGIRQGGGVVVAGNVALVTCSACRDAIERRFGGNEGSES